MARGAPDCTGCWLSTARTTVSSWECFVRTFRSNKNIPSYHAILLLAWAEVWCFYVCLLLSYLRVSRETESDYTSSSIKTIPVIHEPFERLIVDCVGPLPKSKSGHQYILTIILLPRSNSSSHDQSTKSGARHYSILLFLACLRWFSQTRVPISHWKCLHKYWRNWEFNIS